jgi:hypothetical protein
MKSAKIRIETDGIGLLCILGGLSEINNIVADELPEEFNPSLPDDEIESLTGTATAFERINKLMLICIEALRVTGLDAEDLDELEDNTTSNLSNVESLLTGLALNSQQKSQS